MAWIQGSEEQAVSDDKRYLRQLKRDIKKAGNRKMRRYLKDPSADPDEFDYGRKRSEVMNEKPKTERPKTERPQSERPQTVPMQTVPMQTEPMQTEPIQSERPRQEQLAIDQPESDRPAI